MGPVLFSSDTCIEWPTVHRKDDCNLHFLKSFSMSYMNDSAVRKTENFLGVSNRSNSIQGTSQTWVRWAEETSRGQWEAAINTILRGLLKALDLGKVKAALGSSR